MEINGEHIATAFLSCSLRHEDRPFVQYIQEILKAHYIKPIGTVGQFTAAPTNVAESMRKNIPLADFVVIVATPRYVQREINNEHSYQSISEMIHVEAGMAHMADKPVLLFVKEGTKVGNFLPNITQYITLNGAQEDLNNKWRLINSLIKNSCDIVRQKKADAQNRYLLNALKTGLAIVGGFSILSSIVGEDEHE
ncbi:hypothetical protein [Gilvibacter sp.]|uniref:hypothetical protein n=1 Tax=Gilvibacter sp. TaxID=2729997 RepID=UPI003F4A4834